MVYGVVIQTLDRLGGNGITMIFVDAPNARCAEAKAQRVAQDRYHCEVLSDHPVEWPGSDPIGLSERSER